MSGLFAATIPTRRTQMTVTPDGGSPLTIEIRNSIEFSDLLARAEIDVSTLSQADRFKRFAPSSLTDPGTMSLEVFFTGMDDLITLESQTDEDTAIVITFADGSTAECTGWFSGGNASGEHDGKYAGTINFRLTGLIEQGSS